MTEYIREQFPSITLRVEEIHSARELSKPIDGAYYNRYMLANSMAESQNIEWK